MRTHWLGALAIGLLLSSTACAADPPVRLLVPAYFYPAGEGLKAWERLIASAAKAPIVAIVNPGSGPGTAVDANYRTVFERARGSKITLIGYVTLGYAKRPVAAVNADVDRWLTFYPEVQGIFFDEQPSGAEGAPFAAECFAYARRKIRDARIVSNPGVVCAVDYLKDEGSPTVCLFEHETGIDAYQPPDWAARFGSDRFAVLLYRVAGADGMRRSLRAAARKRAGFLYITDAGGANPWDRLPSYWDDEVAELNRITPAR
jgi:hypothetical protein